MKKKIINGIMMVALVAATSTSFVSCKDTNEDVRIEQAAEIAALQGRLTDLENKYGDLDNRVTALRDDVIELQNDMSYTEAEVEILEQRCDQLEAWLEETFAKLVTSIEINGTWNNMTGMVALPGVKANMLIASYGEAGKAGKFPVEGKLADEDEQLVWAEGEKFGYNEDYPTYAGTIYATVNKYLNGDLVLGEDNFGAQLVTTPGNNIDNYVTIAVGNEGKPTEKDLTWGWTRADNNIYEFNIGIKANPEDLGFNILKIEGLKDDLKTILKNGKSTSATELAQAVAKLYYTAIQGGAGSSLPMDALRLGWMDGNEAKSYKAKYEVYDGASNVKTEWEESWTQPTFMNEASHFVQSNADLMLATVKPLAFTTKDATISVTPKVQMTLDYGEKIFNRMMASVNSIISRLVYRVKGGADYDDNYTLQNMMMKSIVSEANTNNHITNATPLASLENGKIYLVDNTAAPTGWDDVNTFYIYVYDNTTGNAISYTSTYVADAGYVVLNPYFAEYLGTQANQINRAIELVQEVLNYAQGNLFKNKIADRILNYSASADKWLGENFNNGLQPTLFAIHGIKNGTKILQTINSTDVKLNRVSGIKGAPLYVKADGTPVILKATSYTLETFAPIMAKFVTITEVDGKAISASEAEALSLKDNNFVAKLGHVAYSYIDQYAFVPEKGKEYTILYEAVDYFGNTTSKYYFIKGE